MYSLALLAVHRYFPYYTASSVSSPVRSISSAPLRAYLQQSAAFAGFDHHVWELIHPWSPTKEINDSERLQVLRHTAGRRRCLRIHFVIKWQNLDKTKGDTMVRSVNTFTTIDAFYSNYRTMHWIENTIITHIIHTPYYSDCLHSTSRGSFQHRNLLCILSVHGSISSLGPDGSQCTETLNNSLDLHSYGRIHKIFTVHS